MIPKLANLDSTLKSDVAEASEIRPLTKTGLLTRILLNKDLDIQ